MDLNQPVVNPHVVDAITKYKAEANEENFSYLTAALLQSNLLLPSRFENPVHEIKDIDGQNHIHLKKGETIALLEISMGEDKFLPLFTDWGKLKQYTTEDFNGQISSFDSHARFAIINNFQGIIINPGSDDFLISKPGMEHFANTSNTPLMKWAGIGLADHFPIDLPLANSGVKNSLKKYLEEPTTENLDIVISGLVRSNFIISINPENTNLKYTLHDNQPYAEPGSEISFLVISYDKGHTATMPAFLDEETYLNSGYEGKSLSLYIRDILLLAHYLGIKTVEIKFDDLSFKISTELTDRIMNIIYSKPNHI